MNRLLQTLMAVALPLVITAVAQAQWVVAFQEKSRRDLNGVFFMDGRYGWVIGDRGIIHTTQDNGGEWLPQSPNLNDNISDIFFRTRDEGWLVTIGSTGSRILKTADGGGTWELMFQLAVAPGAKKDDVPTLYSVAFANDKNGWVIGWNGTILRSGDGGKNWIGQESGTRANLYGLSASKKGVWVVGAEG